MGSNSLVAFGWAAIIALGVPVGSSADERTAVAGAVTLAVADGEVIAAAGTQLTLSCDGHEPSTTVTDDQGEFRFAGLPADHCSIRTELQGFSPQTVRVNTSPGHTTTLRLHLEVTPLYSGVFAKGAGPEVDRQTGCSQGRSQSATTRARLRSKVCTHRD
jgi:hypothetical protein